MHYNLELRNEGALPIPIAWHKKGGFRLSSIDGGKHLMLDCTHILVNENNQLTFQGKETQVTIMPQEGLLIRMADYHLKTKDPNPHMPSGPVAILPADEIPLPKPQEDDIPF